jgi:DNA polymerase III alpha subunit (gram-positive type)
MFVNVNQKIKRGCRVDIGNFLRAKTKLEDEIGDRQIMLIINELEVVKTTNNQDIKPEENIQLDLITMQNYF